MDKRPIGVFDSGLGGLTAVKELAALLPHEDIVYFGDTARVPYGPRSRDTLIKYAQQDIQFLLSNRVKLALAACGTVSSIYPAELAAKLPVPYLGVVQPTARAAVAATKNRRIAIIGQGDGKKQQLCRYHQRAFAGRRAAQHRLPLICTGDRGRIY